jgi:hypothetical protein
MVSIELRDMSENFDMSRYMARKYKQKSRQIALMDSADQDRPGEMSLAEAEKATAFRDCRRAERERACRIQAMPLLLPTS